jgi:hypothetical protein
MPSAEVIDIFEKIKGLPSPQALRLCAELLDACKDTIALLIIQKIAMDVELAAFKKAMSSK